MVKVKDRKVKQDQIANLAFLDDRFDDEFPENYDEYDDGKSAAIAAANGVGRKPKAESRKPKGNEKNKSAISNQQSAIKSKDSVKKEKSTNESKVISKDDPDAIQFFAMGGLEGVGQNMYVYKYKGKLI